MRLARALTIALALAAPVTTGRSLAHAQDMSGAGLQGGIGSLPGTSTSLQDPGGIIGGRAGHPRIQPGQPGVRRRPGFEVLPTPRGRAAAQGRTMPPMALDVPVGPA